MDEINSNSLKEILYSLIESNKSILQEIVDGYYTSASYCLGQQREYLDGLISCYDLEDESE